LLPVGESAPGLTCAAPTAPRRFDRAVIVAIKEVGAATKSVKIGGLQPIDENQRRGAVRVLVAIGQPDRLQRRVAVANRAMRQERCFVIGLQRGVQMFDALRRGGPNDDPMALRESPLEQPR